MQHIFGIYTHLACKILKLFAISVTGSCQLAIKNLEMDQVFFFCYKNSTKCGHNHLVLLWWQMQNLCLDLDQPSVKYVNDWAQNLFHFFLISQAPIVWHIIFLPNILKNLRNCQTIVFPPIPFLKFQTISTNFLTMKLLG